MRTDVVFRRTPLLLTVTCSIGLIGCPSGAERGASLDEPKPAPAIGEEKTMEITSTAFEPGERIPAKYTDDGDDLSPPLAWSGVPEGTRELALICDDPDAPSPKKPRPDPWVHWVLYKIPPERTALPEGVPGAARLDGPPGAIQGENSWPTTGYRGPAPPRGSGTHRYFFKLYALDAELEIEPGADKAALLEAMSGHVLGEGELVGTYER